MRLTKEDIQVIETLVRQQWSDTTNPDHVRFDSWLGVDQDQALALIEMVPNRLPVTPVMCPIFPEEFARRVSLEG